MSVAYLTRADRRLARLRAVRTLAVAGLGLLLCTALDPLVFRALAERTADGSLRADRGVEGEDWYRLLRVTGFAGTWALVALCLLLHDRRAAATTPMQVQGRRSDLRKDDGRRDPFRRAAIVLASAVLAGLAAELLKLVFGRERPVDGLDYQGFVFKPWPSALLGDGSNLGLPSSHAATAFGGCAALALLFPPVAPAVLLLAAGCAFSRVLVGAHWLSDTYLGALVGLASARWIHPRFGARRPSPTRLPGRLG